MTENQTPDVIIRGKAIKFHEFDPKLGRIFSFTENELNWNHKGKLSTLQRERFLAKRDKYVGLLVVSAVVLLFILFGFVTQLHTNISQVPAGAQIIFGVIPIWMLIAAVIIWRNRTQEIENELVAITTGELKLSVKGTKGGTYNLMIVNHLDWQITDPQFNRLSKLHNQDDGMTHVAVYYLPKSDQLLSIVEVDMLANHANESSNTDIAGDELTIGVFASFRRLIVNLLKL